MKANELRIGNYVIDNLGGILKIKGVNENSTLSHVKGIKLNEEWLFKFCFKKASENFLSIKTKKRFSNLEINLKTKRAIIFGLHSFKDVVFPEYVHELQNLYFALTHEELIIK